MAVLNMQLDDDVHRAAKHAAVDAGESLKAWVTKAIKEKLDRDTTLRRR